MNRRKILVGVISICAFVVMLVMMLNWTKSLGEMVEYLRSMQLPILLLLVPNFMLMFYAAGRIWYPYMKQYGLTAGELGRIEYELHFVNTVVPSASVSGMVYATERLKQYGAPMGYIGGMYVYRYMVSIVTNWIGIIGAALLLLWAGKLKDMPLMPLAFVAAMIGVAVLVFVGILLMLTGKVHIKHEKLGKYIEDLRHSLIYALKDKRAMLSSWLWGMAYTVLEDTPFLIVAWALGSPELFLQMVVAAAVGVIVGLLIPTPGGIGGFEGAMIYLLGGFGTNIALASAIVVLTRMITLIGTITTSYPFWQKGMIKIGKSPA